MQVFMMPLIHKKQQFHLQRSSQNPNYLEPQKPTKYQPLFAVQERKNLSAG
jgi:hypothetical protein